MQKFTGCDTGILKNNNQNQMKPLHYQLAFKIIIENRHPGWKPKPNMTTISMAWYHHGDSYSAWYDHGGSFSTWYGHGIDIMECSMILTWTSWKTAWSCYGGHDYYYNVVRALIIQLTLLISTHLLLFCAIFKIWKQNFPLK